MANSTLTSGETICWEPFLVRKLTIETGTTAAALAHGGPAAKPDMYFGALEEANPTASEFSLQSPTTTTLTVEGEADSKTLIVYCIWFESAAGGIS
jgi:hypothetical protein